MGACYELIDVRNEIRYDFGKNNSPSIIFNFLKDKDITVDEIQEYVVEYINWTDNTTEEYKNTLGLVLHNIFKNNEILIERDDYIESLDGQECLIDNIEEVFGINFDYYYDRFEKVDIDDVIEFEMK